MIRDTRELSASLAYLSSWADKLEGLRQHSEKTETSLLSTTSAGPLAEIRRVIMEAREFVEGLPEEPAVIGDYHLSAQDRQKVA